MNHGFIVTVHEEFLLNSHYGSHHIIESLLTHSDHLDEFSRLITLLLYEKRSRVILIHPGFGFTETALYLQFRDVIDQGESYDTLLHFHGEIRHNVAGAVVSHIAGKRCRGLGVQRRDQRYRIFQFNVTYAESRRKTVIMLT